MDEVLSDLTPAERESMLAMVAQRILSPGSKLSLAQQFRDTLLAWLFSNKRFDEDELYRVMDVLHKNFYRVQKKLQKCNDSVPVLLLYDVTSTYFEGTKAEEGEYGYPRDKRWDRYQIIVGLVCNEQGIPLAVEVWPGNTADKATVATQVKLLKEQFGIEKAVFVGDKGMYSETNIDQIVKAGFDYIVRLDWNKQRTQLEDLAPVQLGLLDEIGIVEWEADGVRYVGCSSEAQRERADGRREAGMVKARQQLEKLARTAAKGAYYSWVRLREKVNKVLKASWVDGLWEVGIAPLEKMDSPEDKMRLQVTAAVDEDAVARREIIEGKYVLQTSLSAKEYSTEKVDKVYRYLQKVERAFRHIKSYLKIRPIYHYKRYKRRRVRAHVLICFLAYYLVKKMELELRALGETREVELLLRSFRPTTVERTSAQGGEVQPARVAVVVGGGGRRDQKRDQWYWVVALPGGASA